MKRARPNRRDMNNTCSILDLYSIQGGPKSEATTFEGSYLAWSESGGGSPSGGSPNGGKLESAKSAETGSKFESILGAPLVIWGNRSKNEPPQGLLLPIGDNTALFCLQHRDRIVTIVCYDVSDVTAPYLLITYSSSLSNKVVPPGETE